MEQEPSKFLFWNIELIIQDKVKRNTTFQVTGLFSVVFISMVERKSILSQRMWVGKRILAMCKNEAFLKIGQFIEMPCLTCCNHNGCSDFVFWRQNVLRRMCHITSQVWGFLFKRNKHPSGISCQMSVQVFMCFGLWLANCCTRTLLFS